MPVLERLSLSPSQKRKSPVFKWTNASSLPVQMPSLLTHESKGILFPSNNLRKLDDLSHTSDKEWTLSDHLSSTIGTPSLSPKDGSGSSSYFTAKTSSAESSYGSAQATHFNSNCISRLININESYGPAFTSKSAEKERKNKANPITIDGSSIDCNTTFDSSLRSDQSSITNDKGKIIPQIANALIEMGKNKRNAFSLKGNYGSGCRPLNVSDDSSSEWSSSLSTSSESADGKLASFERRASKSRRQDFAKYIPVQNIPHVLFVPKCSFHHLNQQEWKDVQKTYEHLTANENLDKVRKSKSYIDSSEANNIDQNKSNGVKNKLSKYFSNIRKRASKVVKKRKHGQFKSDVNVKYPNQYDERFSVVINEQYVTLNTKEFPDLKAIIYVEQPANNNPDLCHVKTELLVSALTTFFQPYAKVQCFWVRNLQERVLDLTVGKVVTSRFSQTIHLRTYKAVLVLSPEASQLLKHKNTAFISSLVAVLEISVQKLLVLVDDNNQLE